MRRDVLYFREQSLEVKRELKKMFQKIKIKNIKMESVVLVLKFSFEFRVSQKKPIKFSFHFFLKKVERRKREQEIFF